MARATLIRPPAAPALDGTLRASDVADKNQAAAALSRFIATYLTPPPPQPNIMQTLLSETDHMDPASMEVGNTGMTATADLRSASIPGLIRRM